jgi:hypothetical protein
VRWNTNSKLKCSSATFARYRFVGSVAFYNADSRTEELLVFDQVENVQRLLETHAFFD